MQHFHPTPLLQNRHLQSCWGVVPTFVWHKPNLTWEEFTLPDDDFIDLCWHGPNAGPLVILLHGLEGSVRSHYIQQLLKTLPLQTVTVHWRSCSGRMNRLARTYNGGNTDDLQSVIAMLCQRYPQRALHAVGFSLGGAILTRYLARYPQNPLTQSIAVSMPYDLSQSADYMPHFYQKRLLVSLKQKLQQKIALGQWPHLSKHDLKPIKTLRQFDDLFTAPIFNYASAEDYYQHESALPALAHVQQPLLIYSCPRRPVCPAAYHPATTASIATRAIRTVSAWWTCWFYRGRALVAITVLAAAAYCTSVSEQAFLISRAGIFKSFLTNCL